MAGTLILAVAGSGKTTHLVDQLLQNRRALVITYTKNNYATIREKVKTRFGQVPANITILTYFTFLYSFCFKPFLYLRERPKGINYEPNRNRGARARARYFDGSNRLYSNRIAKYLEEQGVIPDIKARLNKYFDMVLIDEVQDIAGHDFNLFIELLDAGPAMTMVGDFYQHTFNTSRDGNVNQGLHDDLDAYKARFGDAGVTIEADLLGRSYRCSPATCEFVRDRIGIDIQPHGNGRTAVSFVNNKEQADVIYADDEIVKLFYNDSSKYRCRADNWGNVKGIDGYKDVCVVLNAGTLRAYERDALTQLADVTRNKLYVATTRARGNVYLVPESLYAAYKRA